MGGHVLINRPLPLRSNAIQFVSPQVEARNAERREDAWARGAHYGSFLAGAFSNVGAHSNPAIVYVLEGKIETAAQTYAAGDLFVHPADGTGFTFKNANANEPAKFLLYEILEQKL